MNKNSRLVKEYGQLEEHFPVVESGEIYGNLVRANGNSQFPVQRWFHQKEAFSVELLETLITKWKIPHHTIHRVLDPFCGIGTSLLSTQRLAKKHHRCDLEALGLERNPFLHFVAQTKTRWHEYDARELQSQAARLLRMPAQSRPKHIPTLTTLHRRDVYDPRVLGRALAIREAIQACPKAERAPLLLGYAGVLEAISGARKDGRGLRIVQNKKRVKIAETLKSAWDQMGLDLASAPEYFESVKTEALLGDGRTLTIEGNPTSKVDNFDLIIYSPPYLNNIDYTEVYKIELWMCGFIQTSTEFRELRYKTFRSHPSVRFPDSTSMDSDRRMGKVLPILELLLQALPRDKNFNWRSRLFKAYFDDMYISLSRQIEALASGGWIFCVVGNSLHGPADRPNAQVPVATDLLIAAIAEYLGLEIKAIQVARHLIRRSSNSKFLRESILVMRKS